VLDTINKKATNMDVVQELLEKGAPSALARNIQSLQSLLLQNDPDASAALRRKFPVPFHVLESKDDGERPFLVCGYNVDGQDDTKYRSPWTNNRHSWSYPVIKDEIDESAANEVVATNTESKEVKEEGAAEENSEQKNDTKTENSGADDAPKGDGSDEAKVETPRDVEEEEDELRPLEMTFNEVWDAYKNLYYGHEAAGSVFLKTSESGPFEGMFGIHKTTAIGSWDSASFVRVHEPLETECTYTVETYVCLILQPSVGEDDKEAGRSTKADISLTTFKEVTRPCKIQPEKGIPINVSHIEHIGTLIEANEIDLRSSIEKVLIPKSQEILDTIQKKQISRPMVNPLMGMVMNSDVLKKKLAKAAASSTNE
jgi:F-actin capping protein, beta subunit